MTNTIGATPEERVQRYIAEYEDAPYWGGPTMYPAPPEIADLKALISDRAKLREGLEHVVASYESFRVSRSAVTGRISVAAYHAACDALNTTKGQSNGE